TRGYPGASGTFAGTVRAEGQPDLKGAFRSDAGMSVALRLAGEHPRTGKCDGAGRGSGLVRFDSSGRPAGYIGRNSNEPGAFDSKVSRRHPRPEKAADSKRAGAVWREHHRSREAAWRTWKLSAPADAQSGSAPGAEEANEGVRKRHCRAATAAASRV